MLYVPLGFADRVVSFRAGWTEVEPGVLHVELVEIGQRRRLGKDRRRDVLPDIIRAVAGLAADRAAAW